MDMPFPNLRFTCMGITPPFLVLSGCVPVILGGGQWPPQLINIEKVEITFLYGNYDFSMLMPTEKTIKNVVVFSS